MGAHLLVHCVGDITLDLSEGDEDRNISEDLMGVVLMPVGDDDEHAPRGEAIAALREVAPLLQQRVRVVPEKAVVLAPNEARDLVNLCADLMVRLADDTFEDDERKVFAGCLKTWMLRAASGSET